MRNSSLLLLVLACGPTMAHAITCAVNGNAITCEAPTLKVTCTYDGKYAIECRALDSSPPIVISTPTIIGSVPSSPPALKFSAVSDIPVAGTSFVDHRATITNNGPRTLQTLSVDSGLKNKSFVSCFTPVGTCKVNGPNVTFMLGDINPAQSITVMYRTQ